MNRHYQTQQAERKAASPVERRRFPRVAVAILFYIAFMASASITGGNIGALFHALAIVAAGFALVLIFHGIK